MLWLKIWQLLRFIMVFFFQLRYFFAILKIKNHNKLQPIDFIEPMGGIEPQTHTLRMGVSEKITTSHNKHKQ